MNSELATLQPTKRFSNRVEKFWCITLHKTVFSVLSSSHVIGTHFCADRSARILEAGSVYTYSSCPLANEE